MIFKIPYTAIKKNTLLWIKTFLAIVIFIINRILTLLLILSSSPIWLPIIIWKTGLIVSDHIMKSITDD